MRKYVTQHNVLGYKIDQYFREHKLAIELDENGHSDINVKYKIKRQKAIEPELGCKFITISPDKEDIFRNINEIFRRIKQSPKKT